MPAAPAARRPATGIEQDSIALIIATRVALYRESLAEAAGPVATTIQVQSFAGLATGDRVRLDDGITSDWFVTVAQHDLAGAALTGKDDMLTVVTQNVLASE